MRQRRRPYREDDDVDDEGAISDNLAAVNSRLDDLTRQLERMAHAGGDRRSSADDPKADRVADALARLDRRLDQIVRSERPAPAALAPRAPSPPPPQPAPAPAPARGITSWVAQISARQRALEGGAPAAAAAPVVAMPAEPAPAAWQQQPDFGGLERQLEQINAQISSLQRPYDDAFETLRGDLSDIRRAVNEALPKRAIESLEGDVRKLADRLDRTRQSGADGAALGTLERGLQEVRDALRGLTPAENLVGFEDAVRGLSDRIDQIAASSRPAQDPQSLKQIEQAVASLRGIVSHVASDDSLTQLAQEVRTLAGQFERAASDGGSEALSRVEARIANLMERGRGMPPELEEAIHQLSQRLDRMQLSQGDQHALVALEDRIAKLSEKLDASDQRLRQLDAIERGLADLLVYLEDMRRNGRQRAAEPAAAPTPAPIAQQAATPVSAAPMRSPLDLIPDVPAAPKPAAAASPAPPPAPVARQPQQVLAPPVAAAPPAVAQPRPVPASVSRPTQPPHTGERQPIAPDLPPNTPLEPGSGTPRVKPGSPAARIAASEAALGHARPAAAENGTKAAAIAAARNAAKAAYLDTPVDVPQTIRPKSGWLKWPSKKPPKAPADPAPPIQPVLPTTDDGSADAPLSRGARVLRFLKTVLIAASVAIIVIGAAQTAIELLWPDEQATSPAAAPERIAPPNTVPMRPMPSPESSLQPLPGFDNSPTGQIGPSFFDPSTVVVPKPQRDDVTGSIGSQPVQPPRPPAPVAAPVRDAAKDAPNAPGSALLAAAAANNPAAEYELGVRYAEGRGVQPNVAEAVRWLERAANAGFAPAQFRLASLNEKGDGGLKKNLQSARRLYLAAAGKGHAKSMHNLAVLYAEGVDGKPDYKMAAQWFRKAAGYGVVDSQYNLAILYARGIGVETNLSESYKWFALATGNGDSDAGKKRDEVGARLDPATLAAARAAAQAFVPDREPDDAINLRTPPGGWDRAPATAARPAKKPTASNAP